MARLVRHDAHSPNEVKVNNESVWICQCGLSKNKPFCDGSHAKTKDEEKGKLYLYDSKGSRVEVENLY